MSAAPERIHGWRHTQLSIASHYGGLSYQGHGYTIAYSEPGQPLVRDDVLRAEAKAARAAAGGRKTGAAAVTADVAVLFARADSIYKTLPGVDVWDAERDARNWPGSCPLVAHPPCRSWGRLSHMAKPRPDERALAPWAVDQIRKFGGVLEHPSASKLWPEMQLPKPGQRDAWGGWTLPIHQHWFGHKAEKSTLLYIVGCRPGDEPAIPLVLGKALYVVASSLHRNKKSTWARPEVSDAEREHTPPELAEWLVTLARRCRVKAIA